MLDLTDEETRALLNLLVEAIEADRYPLSAACRGIALWIETSPVPRSGEKVFSEV